MLHTTISTVESEIHSIGPSFREEQQQQQEEIIPANSPTRVSDVPVKQSARVVNRKLKNKNWKLRLRIQLIRLQEYFSSGFCVSTMFTCVAMTVSILTVCFFSFRKTEPTCSLTFTPMVVNVNNQNSNPRSIAIGDFNNDTLLDFVVANSYTNNIGISLGSRTGILKAQTTYSTGLDSHPYSVAVGDFNNDRRLDIVVANYGTHTIGIFSGLGNGSFELSTIYSTGSSRPLLVVVGDLHNNQRLDLVVANYDTNNMNIYIGYGNGSFSLPITYLTGDDSIPYSIALADFNHDNYLDIVVANYGTNNIGIFIADQNGSFTNQKTYSTGFASRPYSVIVENFNKDNEVDVIVANSGTGNIGLFVGNGHGTFEKLRIFVTDTFGPLYIVAGDFNKDNKSDVVIANNWNNSICMILGGKSGTFAYKHFYSTGFGSYPSSIAVGDFNGDDRLDIAVANNGTNNIGIFLGYDSEGFDSNNIYSTGEFSTPKSVVIGDFNHDNVTDIAVGNIQADNTGIFFGLGDGTFSNQRTYSTGFNSSVSFITTTDFNNDQHLDIVITASKTDNVGIFFGYGNGSFENMLSISTGRGSSPRSIGIGDFNNDHCMDMVIGKYNMQNIGVFFGYCNRSFAGQIIYTTENMTNPDLVVVADMNHDAYLDIIVVDSFASSFSIFYSYGNGTFRNQTLYTSKSGLSATSLAVADFNHDNQYDLVIAYSLSNNIVIFFGNGNETFATEVSYANDFYSPPYSVSVADLNNDNISDIVVANYHNDNIGVFRGFANGTFDEQVTYATGNDTGPWALTIADVNKDNRHDIIVTYSISNNVAILLAYDFGAVKNQSVYTTGAATHPLSIAVEDFNHDNQLDLAIINYGTEDLEIRLGYGNGNFSNETLYLTGTGSLPSSIALGHFNNDSIIDIAVANFGSNTISIFNGYSNGTFSIQTTCSTGSNSQPVSLVMANINNDIYPDLVVANSGSNTVGIFLGFKYPSFQTQMTYGVEILSHPLSVIVGDFNNDLKLDIITSTDGQSTGSVFLGYGNGSFTATTTFSTVSFRQAQLIASGYFDQDQCLDIVTVNIFQSFFSIFIGHCNGSFKNLGIYSSGNRSYPSSIMTGDFNHDNLTDIALAVPSFNSIYIFLNIDNGTFGNAAKYSTGISSSPSALSKGDFNHDNHLDIVVTNYNSSSITIFYGNINGTFENQRTYSTKTNTNPSLIAVSDFNNDNWLDILVIDVMNSRVGVLLAISNGTFSEEMKYSVNLIDKPSSIAVKDFNHDFHVDIAITGSEKDTLRLYFGNGDGTFGLGTMHTTGDQSSPLSLAVGDFNGDNQQDIAVTNYATSNIGVFLGYCCEPFAYQTTMTTGNNSIPQSVATGDLNNDTRIDLVVANSGMDNIGVFLNYGAGTFANQTTITTGDKSYPISIAVGDLNNDNRLDVIVANYQKETVGVLLGHGDGTFTNISTYHLGVGSRPYSVTVFDFNQDNRLDIIVTDDGTNTVSILQGNGNGNFAKVTHFTTGYESLPYLVAFGDFNRDTLPDIVVSLAGANNIGFISKQC